MNSDLILPNPILSMGAGPGSLTLARQSPPCDGSTADLAAGLP
jgi:hypothetical protein